MSKAGLDNRHRNHDGEISHKHGNTLIGTLRKIYGQSFAAIMKPATSNTRSRTLRSEGVGRISDSVIRHSRSAD